ncbi:MAG: succinylglutamate desuccinylase/aspartoacylase family protein [Candidatus Saccharimonadales bacterium]
MQKILLVGSQHGNELLGVRLHEYITEKKPELLKYVEYYCANPLAFALNKRFIETDMNRSYTNDSSGYEAECAKNLVRKIRAGDYLYVIDCHTTTTEVGVCFIVKERNAAIDRVINAASDITNIILMKKDIARLSLLGTNSNVIAVEANEKIATEETTLSVLLKMIEQLSKNATLEPINRTIYSVDGFIDTTATANLDNVDLCNFKNYKGSYPVLCGGDTKNRTYRGFWSTKQPGVLI